MNIPNTPAELAAMNEDCGGSNVYFNDLVREAMQVISPDNGGTLAHVQAVAEICISALRDIYEISARDESLDDDIRFYSAQMIQKLVAAEALVEDCHHIDSYETPD